MGKGFALGLAEAGADVAVTDVNIESGQLEKVSKQIQDMGRDSMCLKVDISSQDEAKKTAALAISLKVATLPRGIF